MKIMSSHQPKYTQSVQKILNDPITNNSFSAKYLKPILLILQAPERFYFDDITQGKNGFSKKRNDFLNQLLSLWRFLLNRIYESNNISLTIDNLDIEIDNIKSSILNEQNIENIEFNGLENNSSILTQKLTNDKQISGNNKYQEKHFNIQNLKQIEIINQNKNEKSRDSINNNKILNRMAPVEEIQSCQIILSIIERPEFLDEMNWRQIYKSRISDIQIATKKLNEKKNKEIIKKQRSFLSKLLNYRNDTKNVDESIEIVYRDLLFKTTILSIQFLIYFHNSFINKSLSIYEHSIEIKEEKMRFCASVLGVSCASIFPRELSFILISIICKTTMIKLSFDEVRKKRHKKKEENSKRKKEKKQKKDSSNEQTNSIVVNEDDIQNSKINRNNKNHDSFINEEILSNNTLFTNTDNTIELSNSSDLTAKSIDILHDKTVSNHSLKEQKILDLEQTDKNSKKLSNLTNYSISQSILEAFNFNLPINSGIEMSYEILPQLTITTEQNNYLTKFEEKFYEIIPSSKTFFNCFLLHFSDHIHRLDIDYKLVKEYRNLLQVFTTIIVENRKNNDWVEMSTRLLTNKRAINLFLDIELSNTNAYSVDSVFRALDRSERWIQTVGRTSLLRSDLLIKVIEGTLETDHFRISSKVLVFLYNIFDDTHPNVRLILFEYLLKYWGIYLLCHWHNDVRLCFTRLLVYKILKRPQLLSSLSFIERSENIEWEDRTSVSLKSKAETYIYILGLYNENGNLNRLSNLEQELPEHMQISPSQKKYVYKAIQDLSTIQEEYKKWKLNCFLPFKNRLHESKSKKHRIDHIEDFSLTIPYPTIRLPNFSLKDM